MGVDSIIYVTDRNGFCVWQSLDRYYLFEDIREAIGGYQEEGVPIDELIAVMSRPLEKKANQGSDIINRKYHWAEVGLVFLLNVKTITRMATGLYAMIADEGEIECDIRHPAHNRFGEVITSLPYSITRFWTSTPAESSASPV